ncbi:hypothetical protein E3N88_07873 [Mikania micrantha]|uniref:Uncharacterized protein n=1 Tax=Mikania micrantha TaxID=192012 RepID=A0A5N6PFQ3_9ASTR|nr:hypothetical protein E3N88_07873 [Mikania micrantha]
MMKFDVPGKRNSRIPLYEVDVPADWESTAPVIEVDDPVDWERRTLTYQNAVDFRLGIVRSNISTLPPTLEKGKQPENPVRREAGARHMAGEEEGTHRHTDKEKTEPSHHRGPHSEGLAEETVVTSGRRHLLRKWSLETVVFTPDTDIVFKCGRWRVASSASTAETLAFCVHRNMWTQITIERRPVLEMRTVEYSSSSHIRLSLRPDPFDRVLYRSATPSFGAESHAANLGSTKPFPFASTPIRIEGTGEHARMEQVWQPRW